MKYNATFYTKDKGTGQIEAFGSLQIEAGDEDSALAIALNAAAGFDTDDHVLISMSGNIIEL